MIHFYDIVTTENIIRLSDSDDAHGCLQKLQDICKRRLVEPLGSVHRISEICSQVPLSYSEDSMYGYHISFNALQVTRIV